MMLMMIITHWLNGLKQKNCDVCADETCVFKSLNCALTGVRQKIDKDQ